MFTNGLQWPKAFLPTFMVAWFVWYGLTVFWSTVPYSSWFYFWELGSLPLAFIAWTLIDSALKEKTWDYLWAGVMLTAWVLVGIDLWQYLDEFMTRPTGPLMDINSFAAWMNLILFPTIVVYVVRESKRVEPFISRKIDAKSLFYLVTIAALLMSFFSTASRGGFLSWLCTVPIAVWFLRKQRNSLKSLALLGGLTLTSIIFMQYVHHYDMFLELQPHYIAHNMATVSRGLMWIATWNMYLAHPLLGTGLGSYFLYYPAYRLPHELASAGTYAHNDYLQFLAEGGPINLGFLLTFAASLFYGLYTIARRLKQSTDIADKDALYFALGLLLGVFAITGHALGNFIFYNLPLSILAGIFMGRSWQLYGSKQTTQPLLHKIGVSHAVIPSAVFVILSFFGAVYLGIDSASYVLFNNPAWVEPLIKPKPQWLLKSAAIFAGIRPLATAPHSYMAAMYSNLAAHHALSKPDRLLLIKGSLRQYKDSLKGISQQAGVYKEIGDTYVKYGKTLGLNYNQKTIKELYYWHKGLAINPESVSLRYNIAQVAYINRGRISEAVKFLNQGLTRPLFPEQRCSLELYVAVTEFNAGLHKQAVVSLLHIVRKHPSYQPAIKLLQHIK
jgi:O-antigen ligase